MHDAINNQSETARSTVVMVWLDRDQAHWLNIGDSRLYHFRRGRRLMRTGDHSAVQLLMDLGEIDESQMASHPAQNRLYRCLGGLDSPRPDTGHFAVQPGDLLALCSDGVWEYVTEAELWTASARRRSLRRCPFVDGTSRATRRDGGRQRHADPAALGRGHRRPAALATAVLGRIRGAVQPRPPLTAS
ncbi:MAG: SpoIIE family protein phosphatase [Comamonadaceae bacterium]|nr:SpoIIE family protein phosphatase [Comamonadaceae bacterium]